MIHTLDQAHARLMRALDAGASATEWSLIGAASFVLGGEPDATLKALDRAVAIGNPDERATARAWRARVALFWLSDPSAALADLRQGRQEAPSSGAVLTLLPFAFEETGLPSDAWGASVDAFQAFSHWPVVVEAHLQLAYRLGRHGEVWRGGAAALARGVASANLDGASVPESSSARREDAVARYVRLVVIGEWTPERTAGLDALIEAACRAHRRAELLP